MVPQRNIPVVEGRLARLAGRLLQGVWIIFGVLVVLGSAYFVCTIRSVKEANASRSGGCRPDRSQTDSGTPIY